MRRMAKPWMIDELAYAGPEHLDTDFVAGYERKQGHPDPAPDVAVLRDHGALHDKATVVDLGTGTGRLALAAAPHCARAIAVDVSPAMLAHVRAAAGEAGLTNLEIVRAGFLSYEHTGAPADAVHTRNALHQLPDFWKAVALDRIAAILRPGGILRLHDLIYDFHPAEAGPVLERWMAGAVQDPAEGYTADDYATHIRTEFSTYRWLLEPMLDATGFDIVDAAFAGSVYGAYTCVRRG
jgi:SAM-dependent methyltransferase